MCVYRCIRVALSERKGLLYDCEKTSRWFQYTAYQNLHLYGLISGRVAEESRPCQWTLPSLRTLSQVLYPTTNCLRLTQGAVQYERRLAVFATSTILVPT